MPERLYPYSAVLSDHVADEAALRNPHLDTGLWVLIVVVSSFASLPAHYSIRCL